MLRDHVLKETLPNLSIPKGLAGKYNFGKVCSALVRYAKHHKCNLAQYLLCGC